MEKASKSYGAGSGRSRPSSSSKQRGRSSRADRTEKAPTFSGDQSCQILELPDDVLYTIFEYLSPATLCKVCQVCQRFRRLASEDCIWLPHEKERAVLRSNHNRAYRGLGCAKERYRVSLNWEKGYRREVWMLRYSHRLMPWLQRDEDALLVSRGSFILQFDIQDNGYLRERTRVALLGLNTDVTRFVIRNGIVVSGCRGGGISTWEASSGVQLLHYKEAHHSDTQCVDIIEKVIVSGSKDRTVKVLSMFPEDREREKKCFNIGDRVWSLSASPDANTVAVGTACYNNPAIALLDINRGEFLGHLGDQHKRGSGVLDMKFESPNVLLTCGHDTYLRMWDLRTNTCVSMWEDQFDSAVYCLQSDGQNTMLTGTARHGLVRLWDKRQQQHVQAYYSGHQNSPVYSLAGSSHHLYLAMDLGLDLVDFSVR